MYSFKRLKYLFRHGRLELDIYGIDKIIDGILCKIYHAVCRLCTRRCVCTVLCFVVVTSTSGVPPRAQYILSTCTAVLPVQNPEIRKSISSHDITTTQHIE